MPSISPKPQVCLYAKSPAQARSHLTQIADLLEKQGLCCNLSDPVECDQAAVLLIDEKSTLSEIPAVFKECLSSGQTVMIIYTGEKPLPFYQSWQWLGVGAEEVLCLRDRIDVGRILRARLERRAYIDRLLTTDRITKVLIGSSLAWKKVLRQAIEIACFSTAPVLIQGESGTGKELIARLIHELDRRPDKQDLVLLDCTTIVPELSGSEFFGHEKGAFTNAVATRDGAFALSDRGTLFLDEIGELRLPLQAELLRVSQEGTFKRVGSNMWKKAKFRLVSATHRNLLKEVEKGNFRQDLYYRIRTCTLRLPPLRERRIDIPDMARFFLARELNDLEPPEFTPLVLHYLMSRDYPGNVRELRQLMARIAYRHCGCGPITLGDIPPVDREMISPEAHSWQENGFRSAIRQAIAEGIGLKEIKRIAGDVALETAIEDADGNLQEAARQLAVTDRLVQGYWAGRRPNGN